MNTGAIDVIAGPMFSGKSEELIRRIRRARIARLNTLVFKHRADNRYSTSHVVSHSEWSVPSSIIDDAAELLHLVDPSTQVIGIDEAHFFDVTFVGVVGELANRGIRVIVAGLDLDYLRQPFGPMPQLLALAEHVTKTNAVCLRCGSPAHFTQRIVASDQRVLVGAAESYEARCRRCHIVGTDVPTVVLSQGDITGTH
jgi:thymidine kinase